MKKASILILFTIISFHVFGQSKYYPVSYPDSIIPRDFNKVNDDIMNDRYNDKPLENLIFVNVSFKCGVDPCKKNKKYSKIDITTFDNNREMKYYTSGKYKIKKLSKNSYLQTVIPTDKIYFQSTGKVATKMRYNDEGFRVNENYYHLNHENGKTYIQSFLDNSGIYKTTQIFSEDGKILIDAKTNVANKGKFDCKSDKIQGCYKYDYLKEDIDISLFANEKSLITHKNQDVFTGYATAGDYYSKTGYQFSGYIIPMTDYQFGNGSVLLMTDLNTGKKKWIIYANQSINFEMDAPDDATLDIDALHKNLNIDFFTYSYKKIINAKGKKDTEPHKIWLDNGMYDFTNMPVINIETKNIQTIDGYAMSIKTFSEETGYYPFATKLCRVGFFKNGKLNGIGFRSKVNTYSVNVEYGYFKNGILIDGHSYNGKDDKKINIWKIPRIKGFRYENTKDVNAVTRNKKLHFTDLYKGDKVYVKSVKRIVNVFKVDMDKREIWVTGLENERAVIDLDKEEVFLYENKETYKDYVSRCNICYGSGKTYTDIYKTEIKKYSHTSGTMTLLDSNHKLAKGTITYTADIPYQVKTGTEQHVCPNCNGTGKISTPDSQNHFFLTPICTGCPTKKEMQEAKDEKIRIAEAKKIKEKQELDALLADCHIDEDCIIKKCPDTKCLRIKFDEKAEFLKKSGASGEILYNEMVKYIIKIDKLRPGTVFDILNHEESISNKGLKYIMQQLPLEISEKINKKAQAALDNR